MNTTDPTIRVMIADDHPLFREGLRMLLEAERTFDVVGEAGDGEMAVEMAIRLQPDILLLDVAMPRLTGLEALSRINPECPNTRTVLLTASIDRARILEALKAGACGVILKESASQLLYRCLREVMAGGHWLERGVVDDLVQALRQLEKAPIEAPAPMTLLTARERQIVSAIVEGSTNEEIGRQFGIRRQTVKNRLSGIFDKCGVSSRVELAVFAINHHLGEGEYTSVYRWEREVGNRA